MKSAVKLFALVMSLCLIFTCLVLTPSVGAVNANEATITAESKTVIAGDEFDVTISLSNNPGIAAMRLAVEFDENVLTLNSAVDEGVLGSAQFSDIMTSPYILAWNTDNVADTDYTANGTIVTLNFTAKSDAIAALTNIKVYAINEEDIFNSDMMPVKVEFVNGVIRFGNSNYALGSLNVRLGTDITVNCYATLKSGVVNVEDFAVRFTLLGDSMIVTGESTETADKYSFTFPRVAPQLLGETITVELLYNEEVVDVKSFSVKEYCEKLLSKSAAELNYSDEQYAAMETLIADLLEYGAAYQTYRNHKTDELVNVGVTGQTTFVPLTSTDFKLVGSAISSSTRLTGAGLYVDNINRLYFKFKASNPERVTIKIWRGDELVKEYSSDDFIIDGNDYKVYTDDIYATQFDDVYKATMIYTYENKDTKYEYIGQSVYYSVNSYVYAMQNNTDEIGALSKAVYNYGVSSVAFKNAQ